MARSHRFPFDEGLALAWDWQVAPTRIERGQAIALNGGGDQSRVQVRPDAKVWINPLALDPSRESALITRKIAARLAALARSLEAAQLTRRVLCVKNVRTDRCSASLQAGEPKGIKECTPA